MVKEVNLHQKNLLTIVKFNMKVKTTAAAPWSNGICERHNATIRNILKMRNDNVIGKLPLLGQLVRKTVL